jgi:hypothetical protein
LLQGFSENPTARLVVDGASRRFFSSLLSPAAHFRRALRPARPRRPGHQVSVAVDGAAFHFVGFVSEIDSPYPRLFDEVWISSSFRQNATSPRKLAKIFRVFHALSFR